jgi:nitrile hydratase
MNGAHDFGGGMGFGPVLPDEGEPVFHAEWEKRALAVTVAAGALGEWTIDAARHAREARHPVDYLTSSYYEIWIKGLESLLIAHGLASAEEIAGGKALGAPKRTRTPLAKDSIVAALAAGTTYSRPATAPARFAPGDRVRARNLNPAGHTRLPRYVRGRLGRIERAHGVFVFPDASAQGLGERPQWLYSVGFRAAELWGAESEAGAEVFVDAWESYLEGATP